MRSQLRQGSLATALRKGRRNHCLQLQERTDTDLLQGHAASAPDTGGDAMLVSQLSMSTVSTASTFVPADITPAIERMLQVGCLKAALDCLCKCLGSEACLASVATDSIKVALESICVYPGCRACLASLSTECMKVSVSLGRRC